MREHAPVVVSRFVEHTDTIPPKRAHLAASHQGALGTRSLFLLCCCRYQRCLRCNIRGYEVTSVTSCCRCLTLILVKNLESVVMSRIVP